MGFYIFPTLPDPAIWDRPEVQAVAAERDIGALYRLLQDCGYSQQKIGAMVGQSQPEVWAVLRGRRIMAYDVLLRIIDGLGMPRGLRSHPTTWPPCSSG